MDIVKLNMLIFQRNILRNLDNKAKCWIVKNRRLGHKVEIWKNPNNVFECIIVLYSFSINKEQIGQVILKRILNRFD